MCWSPDTIKSTTISSNSNINEVKDTKSSISQTISQKPPKVAATSQYEINEYNPSPIDFTEIDNSLLQRISSMGYSEQDKKYALAAKHVSEYAKRFSDIQDMLIASPKTLDKLDSFLKEIEILKKQIADDSVLNWDETGKITPDAQAAMTYAEEVETIVRHYRNKITGLETIYTQLTQENVDIDTINSELGKLKKNIVDDEELQREKGAYAKTLNQKVNQVERRLEAAENYKEFRRQILKIKEEIQDQTYESVYNLKSSLEIVEYNILNNSLFTGENKIFASRLKDQLKETKEILEERIEFLTNKEMTKILGNNLKDSVLEKLFINDQLSSEAKDALKIFLKKGYLQNKSFLKRLNDIVETGHRYFFEEEGKYNSIRTEEEIFQIQKEVADSLLPEIAKGKPEFVDFLLYGEHLDDLALEIKLELNKTLPKDLIVLKHELAIAKREFAKLLRKEEKSYKNILARLFRKFRKEQKFTGSFYQISFDNTLVDTLINGDGFNYKNIDLMLAKACLLQYKVDKLENKEKEGLDKETLSKLFSKIGLKGDVEEIERLIEQQFRSFEDARKTISSISQFAAELQEDKEAILALYKGLLGNNTAFKAGEVLDKIIKNYLELDSTNAFIFTEYQNMIRERYFSAYIEKAREFLQQRTNITILSPKESELREIVKDLTPPIDENREDRFNCSRAVVQFFKNLEQNKNVHELIKELKEIAKYSLRKLKQPRLSSSTRKELRERIKKVEILLQKRTDVDGINLIKNEIVPYLESYNLKEKAEAILQLYKLENARKYLEETDTKSFLTSDIKIFVDACILKDIFESGVQDIASYIPNLQKIKQWGLKFGFLIEEESNDDLRFIGMDQSFKTIIEEYKQGNKIDKLLQTIQLKKERAQAEEVIVREAPKNVLFEDKVSNLFSTLEDGQKLILSFGKNMEVNLDSTSVSSVDVGLQFNIAKENSVSVIKEGENFIFLLKGGKSVGGTVEVGAIVDALSVSAGIKGGRAKGVKVIFNSSDSAKNFLMHLINPSEKPAPIREATELFFIKEVSLEGGIGANIGVDKEISNTGIDANISVELEAIQTQLFEENARMQTKTVQHTVSVTLGGGVGVNVGDVSSGIEEAKEFSYQVTMEEIRYHGRLTPATNFTKNYGSVQKVLDLESKGLIKLKDETRKILKQMEKDIQEINLRWKLKEDVCFNINEKELSQKQDEAKSLLEDLRSFYPAEIEIIFKNKISSIENSHNFKYVLWTHEVIFESEKTITFDVSEV
ncbi:hypothetical protein [Desulfothermus sp.]